MMLTVMIVVMVVRMMVMVMMTFPQFTRLSSSVK